MRVRPDPNPVDSIESEIRWRARWSGISPKGADERAKQLAGREQDADAFLPDPSSKKGDARKRRPR